MASAGSLLEKSSAAAEKMFRTHQMKGTVFMNLRRILALAGVFIILFLYGASLVLAVIGGPGSLDLLMAALFCTIVVPAVIYGYEILLKNGGSPGVSWKNSADRPSENEKDAENAGAEHPEQRQSGQKKSV